MEALKRVFVVVGSILLGWAVLQFGTSSFRPPAAPAGEAPPTPPADDPVVAAPPAAEPGSVQPNVLIVLWDTVRADRLSLYGHDKPTTPGLEALADASLVFDQARSPGIWTMTAHAALFTGLPASATGADANRMWLDHHHVTMAEWFQKHGYETLSYSANPMLSLATNLTQGFQTVHTAADPVIRPRAMAATAARVLPEDRSNELTEGWKPPSFAPDDEMVRSRNKDAADVLSDAFLAQIGRRPSDAGPFFAYLNFMEAHVPRNPSREGRDAVMDPEVDARALVTDQSHIQLHFYGFGKTRYSDEELEAIAAVYDATLTDLDRATRRLLDGLEAAGVLDDTVVVVTSDHGEHLGDHHLFHHRFSLYDSLARVPLLIRYPPGVQPGRVAEAVSTLDLFGTLVHLTGVPAPPTALGDLLGERSPVVSWMGRPNPREIDAVRRIHADVDPKRWMISGHGWVSDGDKLIVTSDGRKRLFHLPDDPGEVADLSGSEPARVDALDAELVAWRAGVPTYDPALRTPADQPAPSAEVKGQLKALGYVAGEGE